MDAAVKDKSFKICSVLGALDVARLVSSNTRHFFEGAIDDVELVREFVSEAMTNLENMKGSAFPTTLQELSKTLDWKARNFEAETTTVEAGLAYVDDRENRRLEVFVSSRAGGPIVGDKESDLSIVTSVSDIFPWIVDRKSKERKWPVSHQNGRSERANKEPFLFDNIYTAAWIGTVGDAWAYYPPFSVFGHPFTLGDTIPANMNSTELQFVKVNIPANNPDRRASFTPPYPDTAQAGKSIITASAPIYYTGTFHNYTYNDTYIASTGVDIAVASISSLLDVLNDKLAKHSFGILVDSNFNTIVISETVVGRIYPERTGFEDSRVTYNLIDGTILEDRRNQTYLPSDTIVENLTKLKSANWTGLLHSVLDLRRGKRGYSTLNLTLTGHETPIEVYASYERWKYVADWVLLVFTPVLEVENAINVGIFKDDSSHDKEPSIVLHCEKGSALVANAYLENNGNLDVTVTVKELPHWLQLSTAIAQRQRLRSGEILPLQFNVFTEELVVGVSSVSVGFNIEDDDYPDCFYDKDLSLALSVHVGAKDCFVITGDRWRTPDVDGNCVCMANAFETGGKCVSHLILLCSILIPLLLLGFVCVYLYVEKKRTQADSMWVLKTSDLQFNEPPEIVGRGTFGLVLLAEYRGTQVAVKRVIPPHVHRRHSANSKIPSRIETVAEAEQRNSQGFFDFVNSGHLLETGLSGINGSVTVAGEQNKLSRSSRSNGSDAASSESLPFLSGNLRPGYESIGRARLSWKEHTRYQSKYTQLKTAFVDEMRQLSKLRHPCITTVMGAVLSRWEEPLMVMEYMDHGSLYDLLHNETMVLDGELVLPILRDVAQGLRFLHAATPQIIHSDLKAQNILVDNKFRAKVADFGLSGKKQVGAAGTPLCMAPELFLGQTENTAESDVYSFGIILYEMYSRKDPYEGEDLNEVLRLVCDPTVNKRPPIPSTMPFEVASLMSECLAANPRVRPTFNELDKRLKSFDATNVEPGNSKFSMQSKKSRYAAERNASLLLKIFPKHISEALSSGRKVEPEHFDCVTIFFSDIVGFTTISSSLPNIKVSDMLDRLYMRFDSLSLEHDIFKIETVGDAWMGVTNVVKKQYDHTRRIAEFSIDAIAAAGETLIDLEDPERGFVKIRVGFHSGPVLASVVGSRQPRYSIFGDTVNTASRMESNSLPGLIQCSDRASKLLKEQAPDMVMTSRGKINVKGKGEMETYWVNST